MCMIRWSKIVKQQFCVCIHFELIAEPVRAPVSRFSFWRRGRLAFRDFRFWYNPHSIGFWVFFARRRRNFLRNQIDLEWKTFEKQVWIYKIFFFFRACGGKKIIALRGNRYRLMAAFPDGFQPGYSSINWVIIYQAPWNNPLPRSGQIFSRFAAGFYSVAFFIRKSPPKNFISQNFLVRIFLFQKNPRASRGFYFVYFFSRISRGFYLIHFPKTRPEGRGVFRGAWYKESNPKCLKSWKIWAKFEIFFTLYCVGSYTVWVVFCALRLAFLQISVVRTRIVIQVP